MVTSLKDCNGIVIKEGDIIRDPNGFKGRVTFTNGAWRYDIGEGSYLKFNSSLLYKEGIGTIQLEVIVENSYACT